MLLEVRTHHAGEETQGGHEDPRGRTYVSTPMLLRPTFSRSCTAVSIRLDVGRESVRVFIPVLLDAVDWHSQQGKDE